MPLLPDQFVRRRSVSAILTLLLAACSSSDGPTDPGGSEWTLAVGGSVTDLEPGEEITIEFDLRESSPFHAVLWVNAGRDGGYPVPLVHPVRSTRVWDSHRRLNVHLPIIEPGMHRLALGDHTGARSNSVEVEVARVTSGRGAEDVALTLERSFTGLGDGVSGLFETVDVGGRLIFADLLGEEALDAAVESAGMLGGRVGRAMAESYRELSAQDQLQFQAFLVNSGLLDILGQLAQTSPGPIGAVPAPGEVPHLPHAAFFTFDALEGMMATVGPLMDLATVVALFWGPAAAVPASASAGIAFFRALINVLAPTEIVELIAHHPERLEVAMRDKNGAGEAYPAVFWATMRPKNKVVDGVVEGAFDFLVPFSNSGPPKTVKDFLWGFVKDVAGNLYKGLPDVADKLEPGTQEYATRVNVATNPRLYSFTVGDLVDYAGVLNPVLVPLTGPFSAMMKTLVVFDVIEDPTVAGSLTVIVPSSVPEVEDAVLSADWKRDVYSVDGVSEWDGSDPVDASVLAHTWYLGSVELGSFVSEWLNLYSVPWPVSVFASPRVFLHQDGRARRDGVVYTTLGPTTLSGKPRDWVGPDDTVPDDDGFFAEMVFSSELPGQCPGHETELTIEQNGGQRVAYQLSSSRELSVILHGLRPGPNTIVLTGVGSHICRVASPQLGVDLTLRFPNSVNAAAGVPSWLRTREYEPTDAVNLPTAVDTIVLWLPPGFEN